ncbi:MAG: class B sortase [Pseudobutyrivibrio sp.]|nr:class B sortase [Pseudobutyrivibrio sp.]
MKTKKVTSILLSFALLFTCFISPIGTVKADAKTLSLYNENNQVDFASLQAYNPDIYAWIYIPNTKVNYPIVQSTQNDYYLMKNVDGSKGYPGAIYTNKENTKTFQDFNTVIYGHNMKNKSAFGSLHNFDSQAFFDQNQDMLIYTAEGVYSYQIYSTVKYSNALILYSFPSSSEIGRQSFVNMSLTGYAGSSVEHVRSGVRVTTEDKLVTLSTCISDSNYRFLVIAKQTGFTEYNY